MTTYTTPELYLYFGSSYVDVDKNSWLCADEFKSIALPSMARLPQKIRIHITPDPDGKWLHDNGIRLFDTSVGLFDHAADWLSSHNITRFDAEMEILQL